MNPDILTRRPPPCFVLADDGQFYKNPLIVGAWNGAPWSLTFIDHDDGARLFLEVPTWQTTPAQLHAMADMLIRLTHIKMQRRPSVDAEYVGPGRPGYRVYAWEVSVLGPIPAGVVDGQPAYRQPWGRRKGAVTVFDFGRAWG